MKPTLLVLAAGMGSRYGGIKQIDGVGAHGETLLDYGVYDAKESGFGRVVFIIRKDIEKDFRQRVFDRVARNFDASYVFQSMDDLLTEEQKRLSSGRTKPWGTVHALLCAKGAIDEPFAVINADDYYGREAFEILSGHLGALDPDSREHAMVGYVLRNTMSRSGTVSRALCNVKDGYLVDMLEHTKIGWQADQIISEQGNKRTLLSGDEVVSMNFFGFAPSAFESFSGSWDRFITEHAGDPKSEAYLPNGTSEIVTRKEGKVRFYTTDESWFGMTYSEDRPIVKDQLAKKVVAGIYPEKLWAY